MQGRRFFYRAPYFFVFNGTDRNLYTIQEMTEEGIIGLAISLVRPEELSPLPSVISCRFFPCLGPPYFPNTRFSGNVGKLRKVFFHVMER